MLTFSIPITSQSTLPLHQCLVALKKVQRAKRKGCTKSANPNRTVEEEPISHFEGKRETVVCYAHNKGHKTTCFKPRKTCFYSYFGHAQWASKNSYTRVESIV